MDSNATVQWVYTKSSANNFVYYSSATRNTITLVYSDDFYDSPGEDYDNPTDYEALFFPRYVLKSDQNRVTYVFNHIKSFYCSSNGTTYNITQVTSTSYSGGSICKTLITDVNRNAAWPRSNTTLTFTFK